MEYRNVACCVLILGLLGAPAMAADNILRLASTTSAQASGLLGVLIPVFEKQSGYEVVLSATGTGKALQAGRRGEADLLWVHSPAKEKKFVSDGYGLKRYHTMNNDFLIMGFSKPPALPV